MKSIFTVLFVCLAAFSFAQAPAFAKLLNYYNAVKNFNGVILVATNGQIDYLNGKGISSRQSGTTINSKSKFKIASITKTFTAVLALQLMELGKLNFSLLLVSL